jgi:hypothetical protein
MKNLTLALLALTLPVSAFANPDCPELNGTFKNKNAGENSFQEISEIYFSTERSKNKQTTIYEIGQVSVIADGQFYDIDEGTVRAICTPQGILNVVHKHTDGSYQEVSVQAVSDRTIRLVGTVQLPNEKPKSYKLILRK